MGSAITILNDFAKFMQEGGVFMFIIALVWAIGIVICLERYLRLSKYDVDGPSFMNEIQRYVLSSDIQGAIRVCSGSASALAKILKSGLKRAGQNLEQMQNSIDASALEMIPKVELRLTWVAVMANISTLFGLLGTIQGLISSFGALSTVDPSKKAEILATGISTAMNTTALGLVSAISLMILHTFLSSKAEKIINEVDEFSVKLIDLVGTKKHDNE